MKAYYDRRAPEYDEWYEGTGRFAKPERPAWHELLHALADTLRGLPPARTLDVALKLPFRDDAFQRIVTMSFYGHLEGGERERFVGEARRVAPELIVVDAALREGVEREEWQERVLNDGSRWTVYKRYFAPSELLAELGGGRVLLSGGWFRAVAA